jgi:glycosyltransferase involved in cell wall biosynthesis
MSAAAKPPLSVVVASVNGLPYLDECLRALGDNCPEAEVVVADSTDAETRAHVQASYPSVQLISFDQPMTVPELRAAGIAAARAPYVAVIEDHCLVTPGWAAACLGAHRAGHPVVGGPVRNAVTGRIRDWAAFLCEYSAFMDTIAETPDGLTGMNVSYDRRAIELMTELLSEGRWETWLHPYLQQNGIVLHGEPGMLIDHAKDFGVGEFVSQRYHYSRSYAGMRNPELGWKRALYCAGSPLLVPLAYKRLAGNVLARPGRRRELLLATPLMLLYTTVWAFGEAVGYAFGGGRSLLKVR